MAKICIITQDISIGGGVLTKLAEFLSWAKSRGHTCDIYYPVTRAHNNSSEVFLRATGSVIMFHPVPIPTLQRVPPFLLAKTFARRCKIPDKYDAYQLISGHLWLALPFIQQSHPFIAWIAGTHTQTIEAMARTKLRYYYYYNSLTNYLVTRQERLTADYAKCIMVDSQYSANRLINELGASNEVVEILPVPVDTNKFTPGQRISIPHRYILCVARLDREKDIPTLLHAFHILSKAITDVDLWIAGEGKEKSTLQDLCQDLHITDRVRFLGHIHGQELINTYQGASVFTLSSLEETLGIVILEAMACGLPVVVTDCGGPSEIVDDGETGFVVPVRDSNRLAASLSHLLTKPALANKFGKSARQKVLDKYHCNVINNNLDTIYSRIFKIQTSIIKSIE